MKRVLENNFLRVAIDDHGAELVSIYDKEKDREVIWQGDPKFWGRHAPVLFPKNMLPGSMDLPVIQILPVLIPHWIL